MSSRKTFTIHDNLIRSNSLSFIGEFHRSQNGRFILGWSDYDPVSGIGGYRTKGYGQHVLLDGDRVVLRAEKLQRPNDGRVSNEGTFVLNDWMFGEARKGTFYAFDVNGNELIQLIVDAHLRNTGISDDGLYAVCQTAHSDGKYANRLFLFDLGVKSILWSRIPETGWAKDYRFDAEHSRLWLIHEDGRTYSYDFQGNLLDTEKWEKDRIAIASGYELLALAEETRRKLESSDADPAQYDEVLALLQLALNKNVSPYTQAVIHRHIGEIQCKCGRTTDAIQHLEVAIRLNPKVGAKRLLDRLRT